MCIRDRHILALYKSDYYYYQYCKFHLQVVLVYIQPFQRNSLLTSVSQPKIVKNSLKPPNWGFKVINVYISKKLVASACHDKQHVCAYLQPFLR